MSEQPHEAPPGPDSPQSAVGDQASADAPSLPSVEGTEAKSLRFLVRWVAVEVFLYVVVALLLIFLALRRGRLSDAILVLLTLLITTPMILGYRQQALERLRGGRRHLTDTPAASAAEAGPPESGAADRHDAPPPSAG